MPNKENKYSQEEALQDQKLLQNVVEWETQITFCTLYIKHYFFLLIFEDGTI
jgi:hypothetical protein